MIQKEIRYFGERFILACDAKCDKAWGISSRPKRQLSDDPDDFIIFADSRLGIAPQDPGSYEGGHGKPAHEEDRLNKWCCRECERSTLNKPGQEIKLRDWSKDFYNDPKRDDQ